MPRVSRLPAILAVLVLIFAAAVRLAGINFQLWVDEIWSIRLAQTATTPQGVFYLHHDNNHWLNTLWLMYLGPGRPWWMYHLLCEATGIGTVVLAWLISRKNLAVLVLLAASEFLIEFSTDARGYAPEGFFALLCLYAFQRHLARPRRTWAVMMILSAILGFLSHLTFVVVLAGLVASSFIALLRRRASWTKAIVQSAAWWIIPLGVVIRVYIVDIRPMIRGGGPQTPHDLAAQAAAMILGIPVGSILAPICGAIAFLLCLRQFWRLFRAADPAWPLHLAMLLFVPAVLFFWPRTDYVHPRYIYVAVPFLLILLGTELSRWPKIAIPVLLAYCLSNGVIISNLLRFGRGDYLDAVNFMLDSTPSPGVVVATHEQVDPTMMVLQYFAQYPAHPSKRLYTIKTENWGDEYPQWMITQQDRGPVVATSPSVIFLRRADFPKGAVTSGIPWTIYENRTGQANVRDEDLYQLSR